MKRIMIIPVLVNFLLSGGVKADPTIAEVSHSEFQGLRQWHTDYR